MTCREKLALERPELVSFQYDGGCYGCPDDYGYLPDPEHCEGYSAYPDKCTKCWDREIPEESVGICEAVSNLPDDITIDPKEVADEIIHTKEDKMSQNEIRDVLGLPHILDSGERREFESGAVRDIQEGKGRMDLLPWGAIMEVSKHCEAGAVKYGEHNVDKGIPTHSLCDSAARHLAKYLDGWTDEPHLVAAAWNLLWCIQMELKHKEVVDTPWIMKKENTHDTKPE